MLDIHYTLLNLSTYLNRGLNWILMKLDDLCKFTVLNGFFQAVGYWYRHSLRSISLSFIFFWKKKSFWMVIGRSASFFIGHSECDRSGRFIGRKWNAWVPQKKRVIKKTSALFRCLKDFFKNIVQPRKKDYANFRVFEEKGSQNQWNT